MIQRKQMQQKIKNNRNHKTKTNTKTNTHTKKKIIGGCGINMRPYLDYSAYFNPTSGGGRMSTNTSTNTNTNNNSNENQGNPRSFTLVDFPQKGHNYGNFLANSPMQAAHKALRQLLNQIQIRENQLLVFTLLDTNNKKEYQYIGTPVQLVKPVEVDYENHTKKYNYRYVISRYNGDLEEYRLYGGGGCKSKCGTNRIYNNKKFFVITK